MARLNLLHRVLLVGVHLEELSDALLLAPGGVDDLRPGGEFAGVDADVGQLTEERVCRNLERQGRERLVLDRPAGHRHRLIPGLIALHRIHVGGRRQEVHHGVQHGLDTTVLEGGSAEDGVGLTVDGELADTGLQLLDADLFTLEVLLHELLVGLRDVLNQLVAVLFSTFLEILRDLVHLILGAHGDITLGVAGPQQGLHGQQVHHAGEVALGPDGQLP